MAALQNTKIPRTIDAGDFLALLMEAENAIGERSWKIKKNGGGNEILL